MQRLRRGARVAAGAPCRSDVAARFQVAARAPARTSSVLPTRMANAGSTPSSSSGGGCGDAQGVASAARLFRNRAAPAAPARGRALRTAVVCMVGAWPMCLSMHACMPPGCAAAMPNTLRHLLDLM
eukprot:364139-Chlamydomonas_euryale.AAC.6